MGIADRDLRRHLLAGGPVVSGWCMIPSPTTAELMAAIGFDALTIDLQHGLIDYGQALTMLQAVARPGIATLCRIPWNEPGIIGKVLDAGFSGIICPMVDTPEEAERLVRACRYAPLGSRSYGPTRARRLHGQDYGALANERITVLAMIETAAGLANLDAILDVPGHRRGVYRAGRPRPVAWACASAELRRARSHLGHRRYPGEGPGTRQGGRHP